MDWMGCAGVLPPLRMEGNAAMTRPVLLDFVDVAKEWGMSPQAVQRAADRVGLTVYMGRKPKIPEDDLKRLIASCQGQAKGRASTGESRPKPAQDNGLSSTGKQSAKQAQLIAEKLTKRLPTTSTHGESTVTPIRPKLS